MESFVQSLESYTAADPNPRRLAVQRKLVLTVATAVVGMVGHAPGPVVRLGLSAVAYGQSRELSGLDWVARTSTTPAETIELIEREGESFPRSPTVLPLPSHYLETPPRQGGRDRECVEVADQVVSWSGDFVIGGTVPNPVAGDRAEMKFWWTPLEQIPGMSLQVRAMRLDAPGETLRFRVDRTAVPVPSRGDDMFFPWWVEFPEAGRWIVVGTSNRNWGCFVVDQRER
jgi:hypothetical protein